ncbi:ATP-dependent 6-phosphofructokinase 4, chloroplastic isoform X2 [Jatropha curcas]|uniref:ATP-dependent 6-phosphofructokinase 4, chloroplastic isoform X2 n=1 Tax=Jatropha curcas TaxID=180498 RepID=UPI0009D6BABB|nr:ATP-dependent 6-phosphofructokinase 4, chloroplastic isoform X2 [Jatropha curcas]
MDLSIPSSFFETFSSHSLLHPLFPSNFQKLRSFPINSYFNLKSRKFPSKSLSWRQNCNYLRSQISSGNVDDVFVLEDVPHLTDFLPDLASYSNPLKKSQAYAIVKQSFVTSEDVVAQKIVVQRNSPRGVHFRRAGPREKVYFTPEEVRACIVTCGGLCPGINTVIREIVCGLNYMYGVDNVLGIEVYIIGGDGTQKGAALIYKEVEKRGLRVAVAGIPKTIDNDIAVIDKSFGFDTAVEEAQRAINAAHVEVESVENGVGIVKLMGRYCGFIATHATLASRDVDCCLIPESPFYLEGPDGLFEYIELRLKENGHLVIVVAEGAGQDYVAQSTHAAYEKDASGNKLLLDVGLWLSQKIKDHFVNVRKMEVNMKYIDPTYMIRAIPSNASDNIYCTLLAHSAVHGAMAGYTGFTVGPVNSRHAYIPISRVTEATNTVKLTDRMWARLLASTNQPSFLNSNDMLQERSIDGETVTVTKTT